MGKGSKPKKPAPEAPPVATTSADAGMRSINNRQRKKNRYSSSDTLLSNQTGFTAQDLDPRG